MTWLLAFLAVGATGRLTRLVTRDSITEPFRLWVENKAGEVWVAHGKPAMLERQMRQTRGGPFAWWKTKYHGFWPWLDDLIHCPWCTSIWLSAPVGYATVWHGTNRVVLTGLLALTASWVASYVQVHAEPK